VKPEIGIGPRSERPNRRRTKFSSQTTRTSDVRKMWMFANSRDAFVQRVPHLSMRAEIQLTVNGKSESVTVETERTLLDFLREDLHLTGTKYGCGEGACRACTVLLDGRPVQSCLTPLSAARGKKVETIEGLALDGKLHPVQEAFLQEEAMQCGYCVPGMIMSTVALLRTRPSANREEMIQALNGNLCRCCGYGNLLQAVERACKKEGAL
jgi:aerobic-type carbon monoxide dehydrogenase small subunit (CoxS/CutS family)